MTGAETGSKAGSDLIGLPADADDPVFREPWEASAFALTVQLIDRGIFTRAEWATALGARIHNSNEAALPAERKSLPDADYYHHWLAALEDLALAKGIATSEDLDTLRQSWRSAYLSTPHGQPVSL
jgi:nitrile hydratase accessory protein